MTIKGSCLCRAVQFEVDQFTGPFEICHCSRCRKVSGAQGMPAIGCNTKDYRLTSGANHIKRYAAPILHSPPHYTVLFCDICGSPVPPAEPSGDFMEIPAGLLDDDPKIHPDKHIFVEHLPKWDAIHDKLPTMTRHEIIKHRSSN